MRISIIDSAECSCCTILLIFHVFVRRISGIDECRSIVLVRGYACVGRRGGLVHEGACVGARGATGSFRHRRPRRTDVDRREYDSCLGGQREETDDLCIPRYKTKHTHRIERVICRL